MRQREKERIKGNADPMFHESGEQLKLESVPGNSEAVRRDEARKRKKK